MPLNRHNSIGIAVAFGYYQKSEQVQLKAWKGRWLTVSPEDGEYPAGLGLREQSKLETRQRIRQAARELFSERGYDSATMRDIATRAQVGLGTLFNYVADKRDLVFLVFNEELDAVTTEALEKADAGQPLHRQLLDIFDSHYRFFARDFVLSRILLKELTFYSERKQADAFLAIRRRLLSGIEERVRTAQQRGTIRTAAAPDIIARHIFFTCSSAIRWWIAAGDPDPAGGLADLSRLLQLQIAGLEPSERFQNI